MKKRLNGREKLQSKIEHLTENQIEQLLTYVKSIENTRAERYAQDPTEDELLAILSSKLENRRARQVFEWESIRRRAEARSVTLSSRI